jgi:1-acyl-sn-glycerol-3-phosphate acyltransferase
MSVGRALAFYAGLYLWTAAMGVASLPLYVLPRGSIVALSRLWVAGVLAILAATTGLRHRVEGRENLPAGPALVASKHQSAWETFALALLLRDPAIILKKSLLWIPFYGWALARIGMIGIDRAAGASALRALTRSASRRVAQGRPILVFPEGTRVAPGARRPYHPGVFALYRALDLPVVPVALNSGLFWPRRRLVKRPGTIAVAFLPPIPPGLDRAAFMAELEARIETTTDRLVSRGEGTSPRPRSPRRTA